MGGEPMGAERPAANRTADEQNQPNKRDRPGGTRRYTYVQHTELFTASGGVHFETRTHMRPTYFVIVVVSHGICAQKKIGASAFAIELRWPQCSVLWWSVKQPTAAAVWECLKIVVILKRLQVCNERKLHELLD